MSPRTGATARWQPATIALALGMLVLGAGIVKSGIGVFPSWAYLYDIAANADDPSRAPLMQPPADYLLANFPGPWVAGQLGLTGRLPYLGFHLAIVGLAVLLPFAMPRIRRDAGRARSLAVMLAGSGVLAVLLGWVGGYDAISFLGLAIGALAGAPAAVAAGWFLVGLNHPGLAAVALVLWLPMAVVLRWRTGGRWALLAGILATAGGVLANGVIVDGWGGATSRWQLLVELASQESVLALVRTWPLVLFGALGMGWIVLAAPGVRRSRAAWLLAAEALLAATVLPLVLIDATRVVALAVAPAMLAWVAWSREARAFGASSTTGWQAPLAAALIAPVPVVWDGGILVGTWGSLGQLDTAWQPPEGYQLLG